MSANYTKSSEPSCSKAMLCNNRRQRERERHQLIRRNCKRVGERERGKETE